MNKITIIGTNPPCPRCGLLTKVIKEKVKEMNLKAEVIHLSYTGPAAKEFANKIGLEPGTAKDVAKRLNENIDAAKINRLIQIKQVNVDCEYRRYNDFNWSIELDKFLKLFEARANDVGILMTPVLIINGELKHQGSVPRLANLMKWLLEMNK